VIASGIHGIPEQVGDAGLLFDPNSVASIRDAMLQVVQNRDLAKDLVTKARERMRLMTQEHYGEQLQQLLDEMRD
jgi:glycosyltransferase involved in cell wall biosynthesis